ncbi:MAG: TerB family tellurite resistance protein [Myxococcales bacterium]|nr:TerB family tellurite resistance protein [Myxococcales bacterium]
MEAYDRLQICRLVSMAIAADGEVVDSELELLDRLMDYYQVDRDERMRIMRREYDFDPTVLTREVKSEEGKAELLGALALAISVDGKIAEPERWLIDRVAATLGVPDAEVERLIGEALASVRRKGGG